MAKKKKSFLAGLFWTLFTIVLIVALLFGGVCVYAKSKFDVDVITTLKQVKSLAQNIDENNAFKNKFGDDDKLSLKNDINAQFSGLITYNETDGYGIGSSSDNITSDLALNEKQLGALFDIFISQMDSDDGFLNFEIGGQKLDIKFLQVALENLTSNSVDMSVTIKISISSLKDSMKDFPLSLVAKLIPDNLYLTSYFTITKGANAFEYTTSSKGIAINGLDKAGTQGLLDTINKFTSLDSVTDSLNSVNDIFANSLIGNSENPNGFAYSLNALGVNDYNFEQVGDANCFVLKK